MDRFKERLFPRKIAAEAWLGGRAWESAPGTAGGQAPRAKMQRRARASGKGAEKDRQEGLSGERDGDLGVADCQGGRPKRRESGVSRKLFGMAGMAGRGPRQGQLTNQDVRPGSWRP